MEKVSIRITLTDKISDGLKKIKSLFDGVVVSSRKATSQTDKFKNVCKQIEFPKAAAILEVVQRIGDQQRDVENNKPGRPYLCGFVHCEAVSGKA